MTAEEIREIVVADITAGVVPVIEMIDLLIEAVQAETLKSFSDALDEALDLPKEAA